MSKRLSALSFNLLPKKKRKGIVLQKEDTIIITIFLIFLILLGGSFYFLNSFKKQLVNEINLVDIELATYNKLKERISRVEKNISSVTLLENKIVMLESESASLRWVFQELQRLTPKSVIYSSLNIDKNSKTVSFQAEADSLKTTSEFIASFKYSENVDKIITNSFSIDKSTGKVRFPVTIIFKKVK